MRRPWRTRRPGGVPEAAGVAALALTAVLTACGPTDAPDAGATDADPTTAVQDPAELLSGDTMRAHPAWTREDVRVLRRVLERARRTGADTLPVGERLAAVGGMFVGAAYVPGTLDPEGPERLVVNLRALDCVTFVETVLTLAHLVEEASRDTRRRDLLRRYDEILTSIRYRDGVLDRYPSRLHYFSEWLSDNEEKGYLDIVTGELGGVEDAEPIAFMTGHRDAYPQLEDPDHFEAIAAIEARLSERPRLYIPEEAVADVADDIRAGDIIAATSTLEGLDVAHTGIAVRIDGELRLMHAPLVGEQVQISERTLAERLLDISTQDGIMVARPVETAALPADAHAENQN